MARTRAAKGGESAEAEPGFDQRLERLEDIVSEMESGELDLEGALERYKEGITLLKGCTGVLSEYRKQVEELTGEAETALRPYGRDPDASDPEATDEET